MTWKQQIDDYERGIAEALDRIAIICDRIDQHITPPPPQPRTGTLAYLSGRWKLRDGTMYGR